LHAISQVTRPAPRPKIYARVARLRGAVATALNGGNYNLAGLIGVRRSYTIGSSANVAGGSRCTPPTAA